MSQPYVYNPSLFRTMTVPFSDNKKRREGISREERDIKISQLEQFIHDNIDITETEADEAEQIIDEIIINQDIPETEAKIFYFIGRLNPPHNGHISALKQMVKMANETSSIPPLILLGSGPGSKRTMDNPITFETKEAYIRSVLEGNYVIQKMTNPAQNISQYIIQKLGDHILKLQNIDITHIAGGKDEDTTKLSFALKSAEKTAQHLVPGADVSTRVEAIEAETTDSGVAMSATKVRKDAYKTFRDGTGFNGWPQEYKQFYRDKAQTIYDEILEPLQEIPPEERNAAIDKYINEGILPSVGQKRKRGGTKKRKYKKYIKKTRKRKRRITRRKR